MKIPKALLKKMVGLACRGEHYRGMEGIHCTRKGSRSAVEVTDGEMLLRAEFDDKTRKTDFEVILSAQAVRLVAFDDEPYVELRETGKPRLMGVEIATVNCKYHDTAEVIQDYGGDCKTFQCNPVVFAKLLSAAAAMTELGSPPCMDIVFPNNPLRPVRMKLVAKDGATVSCVLMQIER